jgi:hypothetical protein
MAVSVVLVVVRNLRSRQMNARNVLRVAFCSSITKICKDKTSRFAYDNNQFNAINIFPFHDRGLEVVRGGRSFRIPGSNVVNCASYPEMKECL